MSWTKKKKKKEIGVNKVMRVRRSCLRLPQFIVKQTARPPLRALCLYSIRLSIFTFEICFWNWANTAWTFTVLLPIDCSRTKRHHIYQEFAHRIFACVERKWKAIRLHLARMAQDWQFDNDFLFLCWTFFWPIKAIEYNSTAKSHS